MASTGNGRCKYYYSDVKIQCVMNKRGAASLRLRHIFNINLSTENNIENTTITSAPQLSGRSSSNLPNNTSDTLNNLI